MKTLAEFDADMAAQRAEFLHKQELVRLLPTTLASIAPYIVHGKTAYKYADHIAYRMPSLAWNVEIAGDRSAVDRIRKLDYFRALLDACAPYVQEIQAVKSASFLSFFPAKFDWETLRDYRESEATASGEYLITHSDYRSAELYFYIQGDTFPLTRISIDVSSIAPEARKLSARGRYVNDKFGNGTRVPASWTFPNLFDVWGAQYCAKRASADRNSYGVPSSYTMEWLIADRACMLAALGVAE